MRRTLLTLLTVAVLLSGCGGRDVSDEQVDDVSRRLSSTTSPFGAPLQKDEAQCVARIYLESDLDESSLEPLERGQVPAPSSPEEAEKLSDITAKITEDCLSR